MSGETARTQSNGQLPYPDRFYAAVDFVSNPPPGTPALSDEAQLLLYALHQQATVGPCKTTKPWGWNVVETAKWKSWNELGDMPTMEAMRLYVRALEDVVHDWYTQAKACKQQLKLGAGAATTAAAAEKDAADAEPSKTPAPAPPPTKPDPKPADYNPLEGHWSTLEVPEGSRKPVPRYEQGAAIIGSTLYVVGGHYGGRYLNDVWSYDMSKREWTALAGRPAAPASAADAPSSMPACAGHSVVPTGPTTLLVLGGHSKAKDQASMAVRSLDVNTLAWTQVEAGGEVQPAPRGGHSSTLLSGKVYVFGGEDAGRKALGDLWVLDTASMQWSALQTSGKGPSPRSAHAATALGNHLVIFGGGSVATCFNDLYVLDLETLEWSTPQQEGAAPTARAGHSGALLGSVWYIIGGGNNVKGCTDMLALDLSRLAAGSATWTVIGQIPSKSPLSSEGISLMPVPLLRSLVAFGGYNGKYHNAVSTFAVGVKAPAQQPAAATAAAAAMPAAEAAKDTPKKAAAANGSAPAVSETPRFPASKPAEDAAQLKGQLEAARKEAEGALRAAAAAKEGAAHELAMMRKELGSTQAALEESERAKEGLAEQLQEEQARVLKLEAQLAEAATKLSQLDELQRELDKVRKHAQELENKKSGGIWGYISGQ